jgi:hypothetical protein
MFHRHRKISVICAVIWPCQRCFGMLGAALAPVRGPYGEVAEWSKAAVLKTVEGQPSVGSNPTLSAISVVAMRTAILRKVFHYPTRRAC